MKEKTMSMNMNMTNRSVYSAIGLLILSGFTFFQFWGYIIPELGKILNLRPENVTTRDVGLMWVPVIGYLLIASNVCLAINIIKPLKGWTETGLVFGFFGSLVAGLVLGLAFALVASLSFGPVLALNVGITLCLVASLSLGLFGGLILEFK
jgi:hypothetical protein